MTKYFQSFATPREAKPLVYDCHEHLTQLNRHEALALFGDPRDLGDLWAKRDTYPVWDVWGVTSTRSEADCRGYTEYQKGRIEASGYPFHQQTDWVIATTETSGDDVATLGTWNYGLVLCEDNVTRLCEVYPGLGFTHVTLSDFLFDAEQDEAEREFIDAVNQAAHNGYTWKDFD